MKVKIKNMENLHDVVAWSSEEIVTTESWYGKTTKIVPVVIIVLRGTKQVKSFPVYEIEELEK